MADRWSSRARVRTRERPCGCAYRCSPCAGGGSRTLTGLATQGILSPSRSAISPLRRISILRARKQLHGLARELWIRHDDLPLIPRRVLTRPQRQHARARLARDERRGG